MRALTRSECFRDFDTYFEPDDVDNFMDEVGFLAKGEKGELSVNEIASLIRDDVEVFPR